jgi:excisionase family DNA binding protein
MNHNHQTTELLSIADTALKLSVSTRTIERLIADGSIHAPKIRRRRLVSVASIQGLLREKNATTLGTRKTKGVEEK